MIDKIGLGTHTAGKQELQKQVGKAGSSCITSTIASRVILSAEQAVIAEAVASRIPGMVARDSSPKSRLRKEAWW